MPTEASSILPPSPPAPLPSLFPFPRCPPRQVGFLHSTTLLSAIQREIEMALKASCRSRKFKGKEVIVRAKKEVIVRGQ